MTGRKTGGERYCLRRVRIKGDGRHAARRTIVVYLAGALVCVCITNIYALFGHGVRSASMDFMFLYPLLCGAAVYLLAHLLFPTLGRRRLYRAACNLYNSGIAAITAGAMLRGIVEIAGTDSDWIPLFRYAGCCFLVVAVLAVVHDKRGLF
jgi:hypothetical protein